MATIVPKTQTRNKSSIETNNGGRRQAGMLDSWYVLSQQGQTFCSREWRQQKCAAPFTPRRATVDDAVMILSTNQ